MKASYQDPTVAGGQAPPPQYPAGPGPAGQVPQQQPPPPGFHQPYDPSKMGDAPPPYPGAAGTTAYPTAGAPYGQQQQQPVHAYYMAPGGHTGGVPHHQQQSATVHHTTAVIITGNCPQCRVGHMREESNAAMCLLVAILAFLFFPIGLLYFLCLPASIIHVCDHCGYSC